MWNSCRYIRNVKFKLLMQILRVAILLKVGALLTSNSTTLSEVFFLESNCSVPLLFIPIQCRDMHQDVRSALITYDFVNKTFEKVSYMYLNHIIIKPLNWGVDIPPGWFLFFFLCQQSKNTTIPVTIIRTRRAMMTYKCVCVLSPNVVPSSGTLLISSGQSGFDV